MPKVECAICGSTREAGIEECRLWEVACETCRRHIEIGKLVEAMPTHATLKNSQFGVWLYDADTICENANVAVGKTPLEALTKGKKA